MKDKIDPKNYKFIFVDLQEKAIKYEEKVKKKAKKRINQALKNTKISRNCNWDKIREHLPIGDDNLPLTEDELHSIFETHIKKRIENNDFDSTSDEEEGAIRERKPRERKKDKRHDKKKKHKRKRSKSSSTEESTERRGKKRDRSEESDRDDREKKRQKTY